MEAKKCKQCGSVTVFSSGKYRCAQCDREYRRQYYETHKEARRAANKRYNATHKEARRAANKRYYEANKDAHNAYCKLWRQQHPEYMREYRARKKAEGK